MTITNILNELYNLAKWKVQKEFVDNLNIKDEHLWLVEIDKIFDKIPTDRKDKFYYLVDKLSVKIKDIDFVCKLTNLSYYIVCTNINNFEVADIFKYAINHKIFDYDLFKEDSDKQGLLF
ncbi:uncharacterized protein VNE69_03281 [Vairimorpha necatrix]|uniref:Uncharacterized protein n=1 Tax=Vairimorpha necatrix TaxID=6039 RepID=A0AAX4JAT9_9MICR